MIIVPSEFVREEIESRMSVDCRVIHHWTDTKRFHPRSQVDARSILGLPMKDKLVLNVSAATSNKNYGLLKDISGLLGRDCRLVKVGGPIPGAKNSIYFPGLNEEMYPLLFNACDLYLHTSRSEGFGRPLVESIASELPVLALRTKVALEVLGDAAVYCEPGMRASEWVKVVHSSLTDSIRNDVIRSERQRSDLFNPAAAHRLYQDVYESVFGG